MTGEELKRHIQSVLPLESLHQMARDYKVVQRERELDIVQLIIALVLSGGTHEGGRQFDALRRYLESGTPRVARQAQESTRPSRSTRSSRSGPETLLAISSVLPGTTIARFWWSMNRAAARAFSSTLAMPASAGSRTASRTMSAT